MDPLDLRRQSMQEYRSVQYDEDATRDLVKALKYNKPMRDELYAHAEGFGRRRPQMEDFRECFPDFPVAMFAYRPQNLQGTAGLSNLFQPKAILKQQFFKHLYDLEEEQEYAVAGRPIGIVIPWPRLKHPVVFHQVPYCEDLGGVRFIINHQLDGKERRRCTLEPLPQFVELVASFE